MGDITGDLAARRGKVGQSEALPGGWILVRAEVPLSELQDYESSLKSLTEGQGSFTMDFAHYEPVSTGIQKRLAEQKGK